MQSGKPIDLSLVNKKMKQRNDIIEHSQSRITDAVTDLADAKAYFAVTKNAYVFQLKDLGRYFEDASVNPAYDGADHLLIVEGAHNETVRPQTQNDSLFTMNEPTVILAPVKYEGGDKYRLIGDKRIACLEWPNTFFADRITDERGMLLTEQNTEKEIFFKVKPLSAIRSVTKKSVISDDENVDSTFQSNSIEGITPALATSAGISVNEALPYLQNVHRIKSRCREHIIAAIRQNLPIDEQEEAIRYYTGFGEGYVFSKESIDDISSQMTTPEHCLLFFEGTRPDPISSPAHYGKPTLIGFVYQLMDDNSLSRVESDPNRRSGIEYPPVLNLPDINNGVPVSIDSGDIYPFL